MPSFSFASLRVRLILLVLLAFLPALGLTLYNAGQARQREAAKVRANASSLFRASPKRVIKTPPCRRGCRAKRACWDSVSA